MSFVVGDCGRRDPKARALGALPPSRNLNVWLHEDRDGKWLLVSHDIHDILDAKRILEILRLDFVDGRIVGGLSPACLSWDDGVRAMAADITSAEPDWIEATGSPVELATLAGEWFDRRIAARAVD